MRTHIIDWRVAVAAIVSMSVGGCEFDWDKWDHQPQSQLDGDARVDAFADGGDTSSDSNSSTDIADASHDGMVGMDASADMAQTSVDVVEASRDVVEAAVDIVDGPLVCSSGTADCDDAGTCVDLLMNVLNCGACDHVCMLPPHATVLCSAGQCGIATCTGTYKDCDGEYNNGCEIDVSSNPADCGMCQVACEHGHACFNGSCEVTVTVLAYDTATNQPIPAAMGTLNIAITNAPAGMCPVVPGDFAPATFTLVAGFPYQLYANEFCPWTFVRWASQTTGTTNIGTTENLTRQFSADETLIAYYMHQ